MIHKEIKAEGDARFCHRCQSDTIYGRNGDGRGVCIVCDIPDEENKIRFSGRKWMS